MYVETHSGEKSSKSNQWKGPSIRFSTLVPPTLVMRELRIWCDAFLHRLWCLYWDNSWYSCFPWLEKATTNSILSPFPSHERTIDAGSKIDPYVLFSLRRPLPSVASTPLLSPAFPMCCSSSLITLEWPYLDGGIRSNICRLPNWIFEPYLNRLAVWVCSCTLQVSAQW